MRRRTLLYLFTLLIAAVSVLAKAEVDSLAWKRLIISEVKLTGTNPANDVGYLELYNASANTMDLSDYWLQSDWGSLKAGNKAIGEGELKVILSGKLAPGATYLVTTIGANNSVDPWGQPNYPDGYFHADLIHRADRVANTIIRWAGYPANVGAMVLSAGQRVGVFYRGDTSTVEGVVARDSVIVDLFMEDNGGGSPSDFPVAGVLTENPGWDYAYVRKFKFKVGNSNFDQSRGSSSEDSEWIVIPEGMMSSKYDKPFTSIGSHSNQTVLDMKANVDGITIDQEKGIINFPYGLRRDSVFRYFDFGPEHAWDFRIGPDTSQWFVSTGDSIDIVVCGDEAKRYSFQAQVEQKPAGFLKVRPLTYKNAGGNWTRRYTVSDGVSPMDTISGIPLYTPTDTLLKYLVVEAGATAEFVFASGQEEIELKKGDMLKVSAGNQSKTYLLSVDPYAPSHDADLRAIYLPGFELWENPITFMYTDTLLSFLPHVKDYIINLPEGTEVPPAIVATAANSRAKVHVARPKSLDGADDDRMAMITVTAEDDTTINTYRILFNVERATPEVQGTPFISDMGFGWKGTNGSFNFQIYNPTSDIIDMSQYVIIRQEGSAPMWDEFASLDNTTAKSMFSDRATDKNINKYLIRPSYWVQKDAEGNPVFALDEVFTGNELEGNGVFTMLMARGFPHTGRVGIPNESDALRGLLDKVDLVVGSRGPNNNALKKAYTCGWYWQEKLNYTPPGSFPYGSDMWKWGFSEPDANLGDSYYLYKLKATLSGDSISDGLKPINTNFDEDFELIDVVNGASLNGVKWKVYDVTNGLDTVYDFEKNTGAGWRAANFERKPWVYTGNAIEGASFGSQSKEGEWMVYGIAPDGGIAKHTVEGESIGALDYGHTRFDNHIMISYAHVPYITSTTYIIGKGLDGEQPILGVPAGTTVDAFMQNIVKPDTGMMVEVMDAEGNIVSGSNVIASNYKVKSTAANGLSSVNYLISVGDLSDDVSLSAKEGSGLVVEGLKVKNIAFGTTLKALLENVDAAATAKVQITDGNEQVIPTEAYGNDSNLVQQNIKSDVLVSTLYVLEVTAQNGTVAEYNLEFAHTDEVYVLSDSYKVYEAYKTIDYVWWTSVEAFKRRLVASPGASMKVMNKIGQERTEGTIQFDDQLVVENGNQRVVYLLKFSNDDRRPVSVAKGDHTIAVGVYPNPTAGMIHVSGLSADQVVSVRNLAGQLVASHKVTSVSTTLNIEGPAGIYFVSFMDAKTNAQVSYKVIKEQ